MLRSVFLSIMVLVLCFSTQNVGALDASKPQISVAPFLQEVQVNPGEPEKSFFVTISNDSNQAHDLVLSIVDFGTLDETGGVAFAGNEFGGKVGKHSLTPWLKLDQTSARLEPAKKVEVKATITNSADLTPGGHYAAVVATVVSADSSNKTSVNFKQKISSLVFATKSGGEKYDLSLKEIASNRKLLSLPTESYVSIKATGNTHIVPRGVVYLKDSSGKVIKRGIINTESGHILPDTSRTFTIPMNTVGSARFWQTKFSLQVDYRYDGIDRFASKTQEIRVISPILIIITGILAVFVALGLKNKSRIITLRKKSK